MKKKKTEDDVAEFSGGPAPKALGPAEIQAKEFGVSRFGGYKMRDVDEFLDEITGAMGALVEENQHLRTGGTSLVGSPDLADVSRQADEIIQRARDEAARITAAAQPAGGAAVASGDRAPVNAFLLQERAFLQQLGTLVQGHMESVKGMAQSSKAAAPAVTAKPAPAPLSPAEPASPPPAPAAKPAPSPAEPAASPSEPNLVEEPAPATARAERSVEEPEGDRSLRELFWGED